MKVFRVAVDDGSSGTSAPPPPAPKVVDEDVPF
jgi:hypothetical protein